MLVVHEYGSEYSGSILREVFDQLSVVLAWETAHHKGRGKIRVHGRKVMRELEV
jgi:hypothetical protein